MNSSMAARARVKLLRGFMIGAALMSAAACTDRAAKERAQADSDLARDLALAGAQPANPTFQDTAVAPAPAPASHATQGPPATAETHVARRPRVQTPRHVDVAQAPAPSPTPAPVTQAPITAAATPASLPATIGSGTGAGMTSGTKVCTTSLPGDKLVATVNEAITGSNGAVIPAGSNVVLEVASATPGDNGDNGQITFRVRSIQVNDKTYPVDATATPTAALEKTKVENPDANADKKKVIGGAIVGGILGQIIGHNTKGTIIGAAAGAATGAVVAHASQKYESCLPAGAAMHLTLNAPLIM